MDIRDHEEKTEAPSVPVTWVEVAKRPAFSEFITELNLSVRDAQEDVATSQNPLGVILFSLTPVGDDFYRQQGLLELAAATVLFVSRDARDWNEALPTLVATERARQIAKFGEQQDHDVTTWTAILGEEIGEMCEAWLDQKNAPSCKNRAHFEEEAVQVIAVCAKWYEAIDGK